MACHPPHPDSLAELRQLRENVSQRGDQCLSLLLAGVELYVSVGREWELLEIMREFAHAAEEMVHNTPTAAQLKELYERGENTPLNP
jgi:hypothetical protein